MRELLVNGHEREGFDINQNNYHLLTEQEKYRQDIFNLFTKLGKVVDSISHITIFLRRYNKDFLFKNGIDDLTYIQYHTEVLFHKVHTILEIMKLMVNKVYLLNIPPKDCSWDSLTAKLNKEKELPLLIINKYYSIFKNMIDMRHLNTHRGLFIDKKMDEIDLDYGFCIYKMVEGQYISEQTETLNNLQISVMKYKLKVFKKERINLTKDVQAHVNTLVSDFLDSLLEKFEFEMTTNE
jgi:hypothetical protein